MSKKKKGKDKSKDKNKDKNKNKGNQQKDKNNGQKTTEESTSTNKTETKDNSSKGLSQFSKKMEEGKLVNLSFVPKGLEKISTFAAMTDKHIKMSQGLASITGSLGEQAQLQNKIFASAQRSGSSYESMANTITQMSVAAGNAFNNDELVSFVELAQKSLKIGGASDEQSGETMNVLTESMKTGSLDEGGFDNIMQNAPQIAESIADATGKSKDELRDMASQGLLTADLIKNAMLESSSQINADFKQVPMTFEDVWTRISNTATKALGPVFDVISGIIESDGFNEFINNICAGIALVAGAVLWVVEAIQTYWGIFGPLIAGVTIAILEFLIIQTAILAANWLMVCWPILLVVLAVSLVIAVVKACGFTFRDMFGFIFGVLAVLRDVFNSVFGGMYTKASEVFHKVTAYIRKIIDYIASAGNWLLKLFGIDEVYQKGKKEGLDNYDEYKVDNSAKKNKPDIPIPDLNSSKYDFGSGISQGGGGITGMPSSPAPSYKMPTSSSNSSLNGYNNDNKNGSGGTPNNSQVNMNNKDKDYLREAAERNYINNFATTTLSPTISVVFEGSGNTSNDEKLAKRISKILTEQIAMVAEGVY